VKDDVDELAAAAGTEFHDAVRLGEQRVVLTQPDVVPGVKTRPALAHDDRARGDDFAAVTLDAEALGVGVAAVARGCGTLLFRHVLLP
jgi:hypothetical protein